MNFIVSLDFDGVLAHGLNVKRKYAKEWFDVDLSLDQTKEEGFNALMQRCGKDINYRSLMDPVNEKHIMEYEVASDCVPVLKTLHDAGCRFVVVSSRNDHDYSYALQYIKDKFDGLIRHTHNTRNTPKDCFLERLRPRLHVDDDLSKLIAVQHLPVELVYYRQPENYGQEVPEEYRYRIWQAHSFEDLSCIVRQAVQMHNEMCKKFNIENKWSRAAEIFSRIYTTTA